MNDNKASQVLRDNADGIVHISRPIIRDVPKLGRNDPCWCESGLKYKKCCWAIDREYVQPQSLQATPDSLEDMDTKELLKIINEGEGDE